MSDLSLISPFVRDILERNQLEPIRVLRYGWRYVCLVVRTGNREAMFKMAFPVAERNTANTPADYVTTGYDEVPALERRILKEALFLQFFSQHQTEFSIEPQIIALSENSPVWSLRTYIPERTMSAWDSNFIFSPRFYDAIEPRHIVDFFASLHGMSNHMPERLTQMIEGFISMLTNTDRLNLTVEHARKLNQFKPIADHLERRFREAAPLYADYERVITQYEPYACHIFAANQQVSLIDWENVGWGHKLQDLSILWMRCFDNPEWQAKYLTVMEEKGYFEDNGRLYWESELLIQSFANRDYFLSHGPIGTTNYDARAVAFFEATINKIMAGSNYFGQD